MKLIRVKRGNAMLIAEKKENNLPYSELHFGHHPNGHKFMTIRRITEGR